jgi:hypothetical protein
MTLLSVTARRLVVETMNLTRAIDAAEEIQWEASPVPKPREDTTQRASGGHGDPTGDIVLDPRRLAVREALAEAESVVRDLSVRVAELQAKVGGTVDAWNGVIE